MKHSYPPKQVFQLDPSTVKSKENDPARISDTTDLQASIAAIGQLVPILVVPIGPDEFQVADGSRRLIACKQLERPVAAIYYDDKDDLLLALAAAANVQKEDTEYFRAKILQGLEEAVGPRRARRIMGIKANTAALYAKMLAAPEEVQEKLRTGKMSVTAFKKIAFQPAAVQTEVVEGEGSVTAAAATRKVKAAKAEAKPRLLDDGAYLLSLAGNARQSLIKLEAAGRIKKEGWVTIHPLLKECGQLIEQIASVQEEV